MLPKLIPGKFSAQLLGCVLMASLLVACTSATPTAAPLTPIEAAAASPTASATPLPPTQTPQPPTATLEPTLTPSPLPSETPVPPTETSTPIPALALQPEGFRGWCLPEGMLVPAVTDPAPANAKVMTLTDGTLDAYNLPGSSCTLIFSFNQILTPEHLQGLKLQIYEITGKTPWLEAALQPLPTDPKSAGVVLTHSYVVAPGWWDISYEYSIASAEGSLIERAPANMHRWKPARCWNDLYPDINTLRCELAQDQHPWDPYYGKTMPTNPPGED